MTALQSLCGIATLSSVVIAAGLATCGGSTRQEKVSDGVRAIARKAQRRVQRKFDHLADEKGKCAQVAVVAVAREQAGFLLAIARDPHIQATT